MNKFISVSWIVFCFSLTGCSALQSKPSQPAKRDAREDQLVVSGRPMPLESVLRYAQNFSGMPPDQQKRELAALNKQRRAESSRMQLALIHSQPGGRFRDTARAQALIDEHLKSPDSRDDGLRTLALLLKMQVAEQQRQEETTTSLQQKLKDEQSRSETLQRKLDELLAVEKAMTERNQIKPK